MNAPDFVVASVRPPFVPGLYPDMPGAMYHAIEAAGSGGIKKLLRSPAHYKLMRDKPDAPTATMQFGTAVHAGVLEAANFDQAVVCAPDVNKRTKDGKAEWEYFASQNAGKTILDAESFDRARRCIDSVNAHPAARGLLDGAQTEVSLFWEDARYKVPCKARLDIQSHGGITDLKTTTDASPEAFARQAASLGYHAQAAHYFSGAEHVLNATPEFWAFICVESEPPHAVAVYTLPGNAILAGGFLCNIALERYAAALASGEWPGYPPTIEALSFPKWATKFDL